MNSWRIFILKIFGAKIGKNTKIRPSVIITYPWNIEIGDDTYIGDDVVLYSLDKINIGNSVSLSYGAFLCTGTHDYTKPTFDLIINPINVKDQAWIGAQAFLHPGINVEKGCVLAARSVLTKSTIELGVYAGSPAKFIKKRI